VNAHQPTIAAAQRKSGNADLRICPAGNRQTEGLRCAVEFAPQHSALGLRAAGCCIDLNCFHKREVDHKSIITDRCTGTTVSASPHCDEKLVLAGKSQYDHDLLLVCAKRDQRRSTIDPSIPNPSSRVVAGVVRRDEPATQVLTKSRNCTRANRSCHLGRVRPEQEDRQELAAGVKNLSPFLFAPLCFGFELHGRRVRRHSRGPRLGLLWCLGQVLATEAIAECIRSGSVGKAESNIGSLCLVPTPATADWDAPLTMEGVKL